MNTTTIQEYKEFIKTTAIYPKDNAIEYLILGLLGETGELCNTYKKVIRDNLPESEYLPKLKKELGDVLWYFYQLGNESEIFDIEIAFNKDASYIPPKTSKLKTLSNTLIRLNTIINRNIDYSFTVNNIPYLQLTKCLTTLIYYHLNSSIEEILQINIDKLSDRKERGVLGGSGDER